MKNILDISNGTAILLSNVDDSTNTIFINGDELPSSDWVGTGDYTFTESGVTFTIQRIAEDSGNIMLQLVSGTTYKLVKNQSYNITDAYYTTDPASTDLADGDYVPFYDTSASAKKKSLWSNIISKIITALSNVFIRINGGATTITGTSAEHADLNTYTTPGNFSCVEDAKSPYVDNQPMTSSQKAFNLIVFKGINSNNYLHQYVIYYNQNTIYSRYSQNAGSTWSSWLNLNSDSTKVAKTGDTMTGNLTVTKQNTAAGTLGEAYIYVGNGTAQASAGNAKGFIRLYSAGTGFTQIQSETNTGGQYNAVLQAKGGTIAYISDIPTIPGVDRGLDFNNNKYYIKAWTLATYTASNANGNVRFRYIQNFAFTYDVLFGVNRTTYAKYVTAVDNGTTYYYAPLAKLTADQATDLLGSRIPTANNSLVNLTRMKSAKGTQTATTTWGIHRENASNYWLVDSSLRAESTSALNTLLASSTWTFSNQGVLYFMYN